MADISLFRVADRPFASGAEFREYLAQEYDADDVDNALTIVVAATERTEDEFFESMHRAGFMLARELGAVRHMLAHVSDGNDLHTYVSYEAETSVVVFYTNYRKTEEVPKIRDFFHIDRKTYPLHFRPRVIQTLLDDLAMEHQEMRITEFTARRYAGSATPARIRPDISRTISYWGNDGRETLQELRYQYGVLPHRVVIDIPLVAKFSVDHRGYFTFHRGDISIVLRLLGTAIDSARETLRAYNSSSFNVFPVRTAHAEFGIPVSIPVTLKLNRPLRADESESLRAALGEGDFTVVDFSAAGEKTFISADLVAKGGYRFRLKADRNQIRMLPEARPELASFMQFYGFVLAVIDPEAQLVA